MMIRPATSSDFDTVSAWLAAARLPVADLAVGQMQDFLVAEHDGEAIGTVGLEQFDDAGLLRSLVVTPRAQGRGAGRQLVAALETMAAARGVTELWLLTTDADSYFSGLSFSSVAREAAPDCIRQTTEFLKLCPGDAILMRKALANRAP